MKIISILLMSFLLTSCAGYRLLDKRNPFAQFGVNKLYVPMFYNHGNLGNNANIFTQEIIDTLSDYRGLELTSSKNGSDAVLLGIIETPKKYQSSVEVLTFKRASNAYGEETLGDNRQDFNTPSVNRLNMTLRIVVIKHPTKEEIAFFQKDITANALSSKIIFNERIPLSGTYTLKELRGDTQMVMGTQTRGQQNQLVYEMAKNAANSFKDMILYAF